MIDVKWTHTMIINKVEEQIRLRRERRKGPHLKKRLFRFYTIICYKLFGWRYQKNMKACKDTSNLGVDEFGRDLDKGMEEYVATLKRRGLKVHTVLVLGSRAKRHWKPKSDLDVMVIASNVPRKGRFGLKRWWALSDRPIYIGVEASGCNMREFLNLLKNFNLWALDAIYYGKVVYDDGFWSVAKKTFQKLEKTYQLQKAPLKQMLLEI